MDCCPPLCASGLGKSRTHSPNRHTRIEGDSCCPVIMGTKEGWLAVRSRMYSSNRSLKGPWSRAMG